jgi:cytochrome b561
MHDKEKLMKQATRTEPSKYPASMRALHWLRAFIVIGTLSVGLLMVNLPDDLPAKFELLYPNHKQFGVLALLLSLAALLVRSRSRVPQPPSALAPWERLLSTFTHRPLYLLLIVVPLMGYSMSSTFSQSDGVPFFFFGQLPELLPKNDRWFEVFQLLHRILAFALLALLVLHVAGALKHRFLDKHADADVLRRML